MESTHRDEHPEPLIVPTVIESKGANWGTETKKVAERDTQRVLEALIAEFGVDAAIRALDNQGLRGSSYGYLLKPLYEEAVNRRARAGAHQDAAG